MIFRIARLIFILSLAGVIAALGCGPTPSETDSNNNNGNPNTTPTLVSLTGPADGSTLSGNVTLSATVANNPAVTAVSFYINGTSPSGATDNYSPYTYNWDTRAYADSSWYSIFAFAVDASADEYFSDTISVFVMNGSNPPGDTTPPFATIIYPHDGTVVSGTIDILADANDNVGVQFVEFYIDDAVPQNAIEYNPPYEHFWDTRSLADQSPHTIYAKAVDLSNNAAFSVAVTVTVDNSGGGSSGTVLNEDFTGRQIRPQNNWWNLDVSSAPLDPSSQNFINWIGPGISMHPDFGQPPYGLPYIGVSGNEPLKIITFTSYGDESDDGAPGRAPGYPIPDEAYLLANFIEGGVPGGGTSGDRHMLIVDRDNWFLFETFGTHWNSSLSRWEASSGAVFNLSTNDRRPEGWTSTDAAGLEVFSGLIKYDEVYGSGEITHAMRFTTRATNGYVWPASHVGGSNSSAPPLGARFRLKASVDISGYSAGMQKIFRAMKKYGLILADNGSDMFIQGTMDNRWNSGVLNPAFHSLSAADFEVIELGWNPVGP